MDRRLVLAIACAGLAAAGVVAWRALRPDDGPRRAVEHWLDAAATGDAGEFCATTTSALRDSNFRDVGARRGPCEARAAVLLGRIQPAYAPFRGARATRSSGDGRRALVAAADVVLRDGSRMSQWRFGGALHAEAKIRVVRSGGAWRVDGSQ